MPGGGCASWWPAGTTQAARLAHNLHGVAGSFGAQRLREAAGTLEQMLEAGDGQADTALGRFEQALHEALESAACITRGEVEMPGLAVARARTEHCGSGFSRERDA